MLTPDQLAEIKRRILLDPADDINTFARHVNEDVRALLAEVERLQVALGERGQALAKYQQACGDHQRNAFAARGDTQAALAALTSAVADRDRAREIAVALEQENARVRGLHSPIVKTLDDDEGTEITACRECDALRESCSDEAEPEPWPCATIRVMDGGEASC